MRTVSIDELDNILEWFDEGYKTSHDEAYKRFSQINVDPPADLPNDPYSQEYMQVQLDLYKRVSNRKEYKPTNEKAYFDVDQCLLRPFPYFTQSTRLAALHYELISKLLYNLDLPAGASICEFGFGWGNTTLALAKLGFKVTAVDIEENYCNLVKRRAEQDQVDINIICDDFLWVKETDEKFDAIVFFECFHHCNRFEQLLEAMHHVLNPGGRIYFAAEPIIPDFPMPWGIRLDGESLFVARRNGWMELGFHSDFFLELLSRTGWSGYEQDPHFWVASSAKEPIIFKPGDKKIHTQCGLVSGSDLIIQSPEKPRSRWYAFYGPHLKIALGNYEGTLSVKSGYDGEEEILIDVVHTHGTRRLTQRTVKKQELKEGKINIKFTVRKNVNDLEVRLQVPSAFQARLSELRIEKIK